MLPTADPPAELEKPTRASRRRGCLVSALLILAALIPGYYLFENWAGRRMLAKEVARYETARISLELEKFLPEAGPPEENFGATPLLDGMMHPDDGYLAGNAAKAKRDALSALLPKRGKSVATGKRVAPVSEPMPEYSEGKPVWDKMRAWLDTYTICKPPADEPSDAKAVFLALDVHRGIFGELVAAARRPRAVFTPSLRERARYLHKIEDLTAFSTTHLPLGRLLALRAHAGLACGEVHEALAMLRVIWRLREASLGGSTLFSHLVANTYGSLWTNTAQVMLAGPDLTDEQLTALAATCGEWSTTQELEQSFRGETALLLHCYRMNREEMQRPEAWGAASGGRKTMVRFGPSGWVDQNVATLLQRRMDHTLGPLLLGGLASLPQALAAAADLIRSSWSWDQWMPSSFLQEPFTESVLIRLIIHRDFQVRLTLLGIAMERYRLKNGRYPSTVAALVPDFLSAVPADLDDAPFRAVTPANGAHCVLYSIGWNLKDDWHGVIPGTWNAQDKQNSEDWHLSLPLQNP